MTNLIMFTLTIDKYYFNDSLVKFFKSEDEKDLAEAMILLITNKELRQTLILNASEFIEKNNWDMKKKEYIDLVNNLAGMKK